MSFGRSVGDIGQAVTLVVKVARALHGIDGATSGYREAMSFLTNLQHTLEPLQTISALNIRVEYHQEIRRTVEYIKEPIDQFLALVRRYDTSLGDRSQTSHHHHIGKKLKWRFVTSKAVSEPKSRIESHLEILEMLLHRLTM